MTLETNDQASRALLARALRRRASDPDAAVRQRCPHLRARRTASAPERQLSDGALVLRTETEAGLDQLRFVLGVDDDHTRVPRALPRRRAARRADPAPPRPAPDPHGDGHACAPAGDRQPADHVARGALDRVAPSARDDGARRPARRTSSAPPPRRRSLRPSSSGSAYPRARRPRSSGSAAPSTRSGCARCPPTRPPPGSSASAASVRTRSASSGRRGSAASTAGSSATSACSRSARRSRVAGSRPRTRHGSSRRYEEWAGLACVYLMAGAARGLVPLKLNPPEVRRERVRARRAESATPAKPAWPLVGVAASALDSGHA